PDYANPGSITKSEIERWGGAGVVEVLGHRSDIVELMHQSSVVVLPSYYGEGLPKVLIEAAACGRAVITTDMPGCRDAIEPKVTGYLVPARDSEALARAMCDLIENPQLFEHMGVAGRRRAEQVFDVNAVVQTHLNIYEALRNNA